MDRFVWLCHGKHRLSVDADEKEQHRWRGDQMGPGYIDSLVWQLFLAVVEFHSQSAEVESRCNTRQFWHNQL